MGERGEKCEHCFMTEGCLYTSQVPHQERKGGLTDRNLQNYLGNVAGMSDCIRPDQRDNAIRKAARRRKVKSPV